MNLQTMVSQRLATVPASGGSLSCHDGQRELVCVLQASHAIAVELSKLHLRTSELTACNQRQLQMLSESICHKLTYLMEPVAPIEVDHEQSVVQMRSVPPQKNDDGRSYYEFLVRRAEGITLHRYQKDSGSPRRSVAAHLTCEVLQRLVGDLESSLNQVT